MSSESRPPTLLDRLARGDVLVSDGATGTYLQRHGLEPGGCPEAFNVTHPEVVMEMSRRYFEAGSDMALTNSFGGSRFMLKKYGFEDRVTEFNREAATLTRAAAPPGRYVIGSVGPTGEFMEPLGEVSEQEMYDGFAEQVAALESGGADGVVIETMTSMEEITTAIRAARENTGLTVMATMTFDRGPRGYFTMMGVTPEVAAVELSQAGADVVGSNCGNGIDAMLEIAGRMRKASTGFLLIHSNAGIPSIIKGEIVYPESPEFMVQRFKRLSDIGVNILGGCCGTGPDHIKALSEALRNSG